MPRRAKQPEPLPAPTFRALGHRDPWDGPDDALTVRVVVEVEESRRRDQVRIERAALAQEQRQAVSAL